MLSKGDKTWLLENLKTIVKEEVQKQLMVEVTFEKVKTEEGIPKGTGELKKENVHITDWWIRYLPQYEAAYRGVQEQIIDLRDRTNALDSFIKRYGRRIEAFKNIMLSLENSIKSIGRFALELQKEKEFRKELADREADLKLIESKPK